MRDLGPTPAPMNSYMLNLGLESLHVRMPRHCENALAVAKFLEAHDKIAWVNYPGLESSRSITSVLRSICRTAHVELCVIWRQGRKSSLQEAFMKELKGCDDSTHWRMHIHAFFILHQLHTDR